MKTQRNSKKSLGVESLEARDLKSGNVAWCVPDAWGGCGYTAPAEVATMSEILEIEVAESAWIGRGR